MLKILYDCIQVFVKEQPSTLNKDICYSSNVFCSNVFLICIDHFCELSPSALTMVPTSLRVWFQVSSWRLPMVSRPRGRFKGGSRASSGGSQNGRRAEVVRVPPNPSGGGGRGEYQ